MYAKKSALFLSIALLFSTPLVMANEPGQNQPSAPKSTSWKDNCVVKFARDNAVVNFACDNSVSNFIRGSKDKWTCTLKDDKGNYSWTEAARQTVRLALITGVGVATYFGVTSKSSKKGKVAKPKRSEARSEATATTAS